MSASSLSSLANSVACCLDPVEAILSFRNVWFEVAPADISAGLDLRCVALAIEPEQLEAATTTLLQAPVAIEPQIYRAAAITHLYSDGRAEQVPIVQLEFVARLEHIASILGALQAAGLLARTKDRMAIVRGLATAFNSDCQIFPASAKAPYSHFVRWRRAPQASGATAESVGAALRLAVDGGEGEEFSEILAAS